MSCADGDLDEHVVTTLLRYVKRVTLHQGCRLPTARPPKWCANVEVIVLR
jgi:hypothetical protein